MKLKLGIAYLSFLFAATLSVVAADSNAVARADEIMSAVVQSRGVASYEFQARLFVTRTEIQPVNILVQRTLDATSTVYRWDGNTNSSSALLVVQSPARRPAMYGAGRGELTGAEQLRPVLRSEITPYDLATSFLWWTDRTYVGEERRHGRDCFVVETRAKGEPYARVRMWIDKEYFGMLRAEAFNAEDQLVKRYMITSFRKVGEAWVPKGIEIATVPVGQALPSQEKSRLELYDGKENPELDESVFSPLNPLWQKPGS